MYKTLCDVPAEKRLEFPVAEDCQLGFCTGAALAGMLPITIYPRWNFLLLAMSQLVLHLDKLPLMAKGVRPRVIIRTAVATRHPLNPGAQHLGDYSEAVNDMLETVHVVELFRADMIVPEYCKAATRDTSTILVERMGHY